MTLGVFSAQDHADDAVLMAAVQGAFFGTNLPAARIEGLIAAHVPKRHIKDVAAVYGTKWWDYRRLSPGHSFLLFAHHYYRSFKIAARRFTRERARQSASQGKRLGSALIGVAPVQYTVEEIWDRDAKHITGMWNAMLTCDALGMPYDQFVRLANQVAIDTMWTRLPQPAQLYSPKLGALVVEEWEKLSESRLFTAQHPMFKVENYAGLPAQDAYRAWLIEQIQQRADKATGLANVVYRTPQLPVDDALAFFGKHQVERARLIAN
ncbi:hypothetical protein SAMN03159338_1584 [Sphingomonas sp. NFR04]|uniref:hypothetical protein n=1 Tax=Sphingomonas sp. NFR04 TaxID=1566283 RepID=UPI0008E91219|nr:hypothetical protein [Sphingomonas sp. NFR04]SFJ50150.1 hypothetical protein SAMN03159338_1584 [Sphingomonas sp. NFR04]